ncbi:hypothetical protein GJ496_003895, partial [Pomphorhynchus laevis]
MEDNEIKREFWIGTGIIASIVLARFLYGAFILGLEGEAFSNFLNNRTSFRLFVGVAAISIALIGGGIVKPKDKKDMHPTRVKRENFGQEVQMDASDHIWFGENKSHLHAAIDHSTEYGAPYEIITDNRTVFAYKTKGRQLLENDTLTQFGFACCQLGTNLCTTSIPEAKGQIER